MSGALLIGGELVPVAGVDVIGPHDAAWSHLDGGDCRPRHGQPQQLILHKTIADDPEDVVPGAGPAGAAERTARYWLGDPAHSGAHLVSGHDGVVACLADLVLTEAYHATVSNPYSIGFETCELAGGRVYQAALEATVKVTLAVVEHVGIQLQVPKRAYNGHPLRRMLDGGRDMVGVFGHRDNTEARGRWDPGDILFGLLVARGHDLVVDGIPGPATVAALKAEGYRGGVWALGRPN